MTKRDPGLQPERTALAWQRTALSAGVAAVLLLRSGLLHAAPLELMASGCALAVAVVAWLVGRRPGNTGAPRRVLLAMTTATCVTGALALAGLLLH
ncbi:DUF202 domain-containing protein [Amycolatopsis taiwanensis]|uniref:DUF202 domain-containing protein n=1 Tax=Amycolatopsis taiwanensis TaxID=342230 RepID=UPI0005C24B05|nr:DUF202 domain-containing protein [Amycolatopsis taiwanensis]